MSDPLAGLPRPLADRDRASRRPTARRSLGAGVLVGLIAVGAAVAATWPGPGPLGVVGAVAGAVATPGPIAPVAAVASPSVLPDRPVVPTTRPTPPRPTPAAVEALTGYQWPLPRGRITLPFGSTPWGSRIVDGEPFHDGLDLATFCGDRVVAAHSGRVLAAGRHYDQYMGWLGDLQPYFDRLDRKKLWSTLPIVVVIDDHNGYRSAYAHFSKVVVKKGQLVEAGDLIGYEGMTGRASGCHVHFSLFSPLETATMAIDPDVAKRMKLPTTEIARVDPLLVLPERPKPTPKPTPTPTIPP